MKIKKISKIALLSAFLMVSLTFLTGCSKVSLTGTSVGDQSGAPAEGGTPPEGETPPNDGGTPPRDGGSAPVGAPSN